MMVTTMMVITTTTINHSEAVNGQGRALYDEPQQLFVVLYIVYKLVMINDVVSIVVVVFGTPLVSKVKT